MIKIATVYSVRRNVKNPGRTAIKSNESYTYEIMIISMLYNITVANLNYYMGCERKNQEVLIYFFRFFSAVSVAYIHSHYSARCMARNMEMEITINIEIPELLCYD